MTSPWADGWGDEVAGRWLAFEAAHDRALQPFGDAALARARPRAGERAIDVGCGCGATSLALADAVGPQGHVLGIDVSPPLLARARQNAVGRGQLQFVEADAQTARLDRDRDLVFSRFGVMFFRDPGAAFRNLAGTLRPGGRLAFVCWRGFEDNPWLHIPFTVARELLPQAPVPPPAGPSPFAFADRSVLEDLIAGAGLGAVEVERVDRQVVLGDDLPAAAEFVMHTGPVGRGLAGTDAATRAQVHQRIVAALSAHARGAPHVSMPGSAWVVRAQSGG